MEKDYSSELEATVKQITSGCKGILACDESPGTMEARFEGKIENTEENRHAIRKTFFEADIKNSIGGVILHEETLKNADTIKTLVDNNIVLGIKTDKGMKELENGKEGEKSTKHGLEGLKERSSEYYKLGARFSKWRAVVKLGKNTPSDASYNDVADALSDYALFSQKGGLVPIIEPEVLGDGTNTIEDCKIATEKIIKMTFAKCAEKKVHMPGSILKVNMVTQGHKCDKKGSPKQVAQLTNEALKNGIGSHKLGAVVFLSGGLSEIDSTNYLMEINKEKKATKTLLNIPFTFSYARALQKTAISMYTGGKDHKEVQKVLAHRCEMNRKAVNMEYDLEMDKDFGGAGQASNFQKDYTY